MSGNYAQYVVELDDSYYRCMEGRLEKIQSLEKIQGDMRLITDLGGAVSKVMTVEAPYKYADMMARKNLQESGEFDEPLSIQTHWKKKKEANTSDIFFTAFSARRYHRFLDQTKAFDDNILMFPVYAILYNSLKRLRHPRPVAVIFQHNRFAEMIIGTRDNIFYAERCVAFDDNEEQISVLWNMIETEIRNTEAENCIKVDKVLLLTWIDTKGTPEWPDNAEWELLSMEEETLSLEGETYSVSLLNAVRMMSGYESASSPMEKISYYSRKNLPFINTFLLVAVILFFAGSLWHGHRADRIEKTLHEGIAMASDFQTKAGISGVAYKETFAFIKELDRCQKTSSLKQVLGDITEALPRQMAADVLKADYDENALRIEIYVKTEEPFDTAYKGYQGFLSLMEQKGYDVKESKFDTTIQDSQFLVIFNKKAK